MAVNKDSKAYQSLLSSGYTDEQIGQMHDAVAGGESVKNVIGGTPAKNANENKQSQTMMVDPIAYRPEYNNGKYDKYIEGRDPTKLNNADINLSQYGDDSSAKNYNNSALWGGENQKYTGENTLGSQIAYNPNATLEGLDPNYLYGQAAQMQNSKQANYIATRNDEIASALYNAGKTSVQDVADFLSKQNQWDYSNENERQNTIQSVWKRIGQIAEMNGQPENPENPEEPNDPLKNMEEDLNKSRAGELYGKVTADSNQPVVTLEDANSVYKAMNESRINAFKNLQTADSNALAAAIVSGSIAYDSQSMRDLMQYDPAKYQEIKNAEKQLRGQMNVNAISSGEGELTTSATNGATGLDNEKTNFANSNSSSGTSTAEILKSVNQTLNSNDAASTASEQMANIEADMATLNNRLKNLKSEANKIFKGDVPQYIVNAYIANRTAEIQDQLSILENRYNAAYTRYQTEREQTKWNAEYNLKLEELALKKQSMALDKYSTEQGIALKWAELNGTTNGTTPLSTLQAQEAMNVLADFSSKYTTGSTGGQCGEFVKKYLAAIGVNLPNMSSINSKKSLIDSSITEPSQGDIVIMSSAKYPQNGHMAIVEGVDDDGTIHLLESNWGGDEKVHRRTISPNNSSILGYYRPTGGTLGTSGSSVYVKDGVFTRKDGQTFNVSVSNILPTLTQAQQEAVFGLINLKVDPSTITKRNYGDGFENIKAAALQIDPSWSEDKFKNQQKVKQEWNTSTKNGSNSRNGTAIATAMELYNMADSLGNQKFTSWNNMLNAVKKKMSNEDFIRFRVKLGTLASEYAGALKGSNAAPTEKEIDDAKLLIAENLSGGGIKASAIEMTKSLFNKNANEAQNYRYETLEKPNLIVTTDVADWMYSVAGITNLSEYYNYNPNSGWAVVANSNVSQSTQNMVTNIFSY